MYPRSPEEKVIEGSIYNFENYMGWGREVKLYNYDSIIKFHFGHKGNRVKGLVYKKGMIE